MASDSRTTPLPPPQHPFWRARGAPELVLQWASTAENKIQASLQEKAEAQARASERGTQLAGLNADLLKARSESRSLRAELDATRTALQAAQKQAAERAAGSVSAAAASPLPQRRAAGMLVPGTPGAEPAADVRHADDMDMDASGAQHSEARHATPAAALGRCSPRQRCGIGRSCGGSLSPLGRVPSRFDLPALPAAGSRRLTRLLARACRLRQVLALRASLEEAKSRAESLQKQLLEEMMQHQGPRSSPSGAALCLVCKRELAADLPAAASRPSDPAAERRSTADQRAAYCQNPIA